MAISLQYQGLKPIERTSIASIVATQLLEELAKNNFASGTRLPSEREMADTLGVGRSTLREALAALDLLGIVEVRPGSGSYLKTDSSQLLPQALQWGLMLAQPEVQDLVKVREHLELLAAMLAAQRASDEDLERLELHLVRMQDSATSVEDFVEADIAFHIETALSGARWRLKGAEAVLKLRAIRKNGDCDSYFAFHLAQERTRVHESRYLTRYLNSVIPPVA